MGERRGAKTHWSGSTIILARLIGRRSATYDLDRPIIHTHTHTALVHISRDDLRVIGARRVATHNEKYDSVRRTAEH